jgi:5-methylcytosine-specific restriction endonuclease McrA
MRFINLDDLEPLIEHLIPALEEAQAEIIAETDPDKRSELFDKHRKHWVALRPYMDALSYGKCWYIECKNPGTDDDVDHFRPKGRVDEARDHPGYYWLALKWWNLRLSCHRANRPRTNPDTNITGGKADHFPLINDPDRAFSPTDPLGRELPGIFDPTNREDVRYLTFLPNGDADLSPEYKGDSVLEKRFADSKRFLNLNWPTFCDERVELYGKILRAMQAGQELDREEPSRSRSIGFRYIVMDLVRFMSAREEYSSAARIYIESFQDLWWVKDMVLRAAK